MITLVVLCLLTLELEGSLCKPISLPNMPSAAQKTAAAQKAAAAAQKKLKAAAPEPSDVPAPETVPDESLAGLTASLFPDTQVDQATLVEGSPSIPFTLPAQGGDSQMGPLSPDGQARDSLGSVEAPHPTHPPQSKDIVCI